MTVNRPTQLANQAAVSAAFDQVLNRRRQARPGRRFTVDEWRRARVGLPADDPYPAQAAAANRRDRAAADRLLTARLDLAAQRQRRRELDRRRKPIHKM